MKRTPEFKSFIPQSAYVSTTVETRLFYQESLKRSISLHVLRK